MTGKAQQELRQTRPFESLAVEATINVMRTADAVLRGLEELLRPYGISHTQYNVLRILRGAGREGLACREVAARMITRDPDITRLLDRLEKNGLVRRARGTKDRRVVNTRITGAGLRLLKRLDQPILDENERALGPLGPKRLRALIALLEDVRSASA